MEEVLKIVLSLNSSKEINLVTAYIRVFFSMLLIVMRPVDKPSDLVTLIMATGGKEVRITALLEARKFRKAYTRLCISILELGHKTRVTCERTSLSCMVVIAALSYRLSLRK